MTSVFPDEPVLTKDTTLEELYEILSTSLLAMQHRVTDESGECVYRTDVDNDGETDGCAVGRCLTDEQVWQLADAGLLDDDAAHALHELFEWDLLGERCRLANQVQVAHDRDFHWSEGFNERGKAFLSRVNPKNNPNNEVIT